MPLVLCQTCGKEFSARPGRIANGRGKYCSRECSAASRRTVDTFTCQWCSREGIRKNVRQKFCSRTCAASAAHAAQFRKAPERRCKVCGARFAPSSFTDMHCSSQCACTGGRDSVLSHGLFEDPWASGAIPPDRYGKDLYRMPDIGLGF